MIFVNEVAEIVHRIVDEYSGSSNKNIGDAFLLVWKYDDKDYDVDSKTKETIVNKEKTSVNALTELAVLSFIKIQPGLARSAKLQKYRNNNAILEIMEDNDFKVKMGFGLHMGWSIEGAIGSKFKIDASYLSPHVNISARLEAATKQFGVSLLISDKVRELVREPLKSMMRQLDCVKVKGSDVDLSIFTIDLDVSDHFYLPQNEEEPKLGMEKKRERVESRKQSNKLKERLSTGELDLKTLISTDGDIARMRKKFTNDFYREWGAGFNCYIRGDWKVAQIKLKKTLNMIPDYEDKPSDVLLKYMERRNFDCPKDWKGVRSLTDK